MQTTVQRVFVEGYGCSANIAETEQIKGFLESQNAVLVEKPSDADFAVINSCGVKKTTERKIARRVQKLSQKNPGLKIIVSGCLPKVNPKALNGIERVVQTGPSLVQIAKAADLKQQEFSPLQIQVRTNPLISIIPIAKGCLSACSFCGTKKARGTLESHSIETIQKRFESDLKNGTKEFWLSSQDNGCYGFDKKTNITELIETLLQNNGAFRIRLGMMSPQYLKKYYKEFVKLFEDKRLYRFVHLPVQSGNNRILKLMKRQHSVEEFRELVKKLREDIPSVSIATDLIVGFPTETRKEFEDTLKLCEELEFETVNISKYSLIPDTPAETLEQIEEKEKSLRSHELTRLCKNIFLKKHEQMVGRKETVLVTQKDRFGHFIGKTNSYREVILKNAEQNKFTKVKITQAFPLYCKGEN